MTKNITLSILLAIMFIIFLGIGLVIPVLPTIMNELHISGSVVGYLTASFALTQLIFSPVTGKLVDRLGRKVIIVVGLIVFSVSELLFGLGRATEWLFLSRILGGLSAALVMPAVTAFIADVTSIQTRAKAIGYMSAAISTGLIIGPGIGGFLAGFGSCVPFFAASVIALLIAVTALLALQEPERQAKTTPGGENSSRKLLQPMFLYAFIVILISSFGLAAFESFFSLYTNHKFGFTPFDIAVAITGGAVVGAAAQILLFERLTRKIGEISIVRWSIAVSIALVVMMTVVTTYWMIMLVTFTVFIGFDLIRPAVTTYLSRIAGDEQGFVGGMNSFFTSFANVLGPVIGGILFDIDLNYPFYFSALVLVAALAVTFFWHKEKPAVS
ncbi:MFS transporter [Macrococcus equipercicus]|uniref:MFS transporter n=1 Tax=Macrococcus equipercicus TaxID=69967 RepID=A0A9Q9F376_9STAP|nr:MFS transporter [Macrococcus equipercicus]UTH13619.1 MFS transporter [Macrococcus equipercicus]